MPYSTNPITNQKNDNMPAWIAPAITAAGQLIGMGIAKGKDKRQLRQQEKLQNLQIKGNQQMMDYQQRLQMEMWENTGYKAQKEQMKEAGINPALLYGMSGGGGQTIGQQSGSVAGGMAPAGSGMEQEQWAGMGIQAAAQLSLLKAQKENIEANTENTKEDTVNKAGGQRTLLGVQADSLSQGIEESKTKQFLMNSEKDLIAMEYNFQQATFEDRADKIVAELKSAKAAGHIDEKTVEDKIIIVEQLAIEAGLKNKNISADTAKKIAEVSQGWKELNIKGKQFKLNELLGKAGLTNKDQDQIIQIVNAVLGGVSIARKKNNLTTIHDNSYRPHETYITNTP